MNNKSIVICPKCEEKQMTETFLRINNSFHKEYAPINTSENYKTKMVCCAYCSTSFFGSYKEQIED